MRKRILPIVFCILLLLSATLPVFAAETGSITVLFQHQNQPVVGAAFKIYKAAEWDGSGYALIDSFSDYAVKMADDADSEEWKTIASTLTAYAERDEIVPFTAGVTNEDGKLSFEGLSNGLYLLVGSPAESGEQRLFTQPMLVTVPYTTTSGEKDYEVETEPKFEARKITEDTVTRRALKIWKDEGNEEKRPQNITVQLLCDGKIYDEQVLDAANNWSYTWEDLDAAHDWQLAEKQVPDDYTVTITQQDITFTVTNTNTNDNPPPTSSGTPASSGMPSVSDTSGTPGETILPQTGLLWWPVPVLGGIGVIALFSGIFLMLREKDGPDA